MRFWTALVLATAGCSGDDGGITRPDPEICDDGVDNNGNGLVDCDDTAFCGGLQCRTGTVDDTATTEPPPIVEVVADSTDCCDFHFGPGDCGLSVGRFTVVNRSTDTDGLVDASCDVVGPGENTLEWQIVGSTNPPIPYIVNAPLYVESQVQLEMFFNCAVTQTFTTTCRVKGEVGSLEDELEFPVTATAVSP